MEKKPYLVITGDCQAFFGWSEEIGPTMVLKDVRRVLRFTPESWELGHSYEELATQGPSEKCFLGVIVGTIWVQNVVHVLEPSDAAVAKWLAWAPERPPGETK